MGGDSPSGDTIATDAEAIPRGFPTWGGIVSTGCDVAGWLEGDFVAAVDKRECFCWDPGGFVTTEGTLTTPGF